MLIFIMNVQKQYHTEYVDKLLDKLLIQYLIKCTNYDDPIIKAYTSENTINNNNTANDLTNID